jgi:hypothetical protein
VTHLEKWFSGIDLLKDEACLIFNPFTIHEIPEAEWDYSLFPSFLIA